MRLSNILFPKSDICNEIELYFKGIGFRFDDCDHVVLNKDGILSAETYFNSFSMRKWKKFTIVENVKVTLKLKGKFDITIFKTDLNEEGDLIREIILKEEFESEQPDEITLPCDSADGIVGWTLNALKDNSEFLGGYYSADVEESLKNDVYLAVGICTFKREQYIIANIDRLKSAIRDTKSPLCGKIKIFVSDNGQTLPYETINDDDVRIVYNKNLGGAGGFARCLIESLNSKERNKFTNFIFMDDDIVLDTNAIEKTFVFLSVLRKEYRESILGGAMFSTDRQYLQFENGGKLEGTRLFFNKRDVDMRISENVVKNEKEADVNYNAWCYCCVPYDIIKENNMPIPLFFHMDDIEFCLRNELPVITLNGINVWHLYKRGITSPKNDYYDVRNKLMITAEISPKRALNQAHNYLDIFTVETLKYHYARAINAFEGLIDFCKGFDYFRKLDTEKKHGKLFNNVRWKDATNEIRGRVQTCENKVSTKYTKYKNAIKILFAKKKGDKYLLNNNTAEDASKAKKVVVLNYQENQYVEYNKDIRLIFKCFAKYVKASYAIKHKLEDAVKEYNLRLSEVQNIDFWNTYLGLENKKYNKRILFVASDNNATSGAFRSMVALNVMLKEKYGVYTYVLLPSAGDGIELLRKNNLKYTIIESEDWIVKLDATKEETDNKKERLKEINGVALKQIEKFMRREKFDVVHVNTSYAFIAAEAACKLDIPVVWHLREFLEEDQDRCFVDKDYAVSLISRADRVIAISDSIKEKYESVFPENLTRIYNGIDERVYFDGEKTIFDGEKVIFICVGELSEYKGQHLLLEACGKLRREGFSNFEIRLVGRTTGAYIVKLKNIISKYGMHDNVKFYGKRKSVHELYKEADIICVCSKSEAFGRITVEAMMTGCLAIGADTAGTKEIIADGSDGILFRSGDSDDLCDKIRYVLDNKDKMKRIAACGRIKATNEFSAIKNAENVYRVYEDIWGGR